MHRTDISGLLILAGSWGPLAASWYETTVKGLQMAGLVLSVLVSCLAVVDFCMKLRNKSKR